MRVRDLLTPLLLLGLSVFWIVRPHGPAPPDPVPTTGGREHPALRGASTPAGAAVVSETADASGGPWPKAVRGRVVVPEGVPVGAARAWLSRGHHRDHDHRAINGRAIELDDEARFAFEVEAPESHQVGYPAIVEVAVAHEGRRWYGVSDLNAGAGELAVNLGTLRPGDPALVRVHGRRGTGEPVGCDGWARVETPARAHIDYDGPHEDDNEPGFAFWFLWDPSVALYVHASADADDLAPLRAGPFPGTTTDIELTFQDAWTLQGTLEGSDGLPIEGATILAAPLERMTPNGHARFAQAQSAKTDASGRFRFGDLCAEQHALDCEVDPALGALPPVTVPPTTADVQLVLARPKAHTLRVRGTEGLPIEGARLQVLPLPAGFEDRDRLPPRRSWHHDDVRPVAEARTDAAGSAVLAGLHDERAYVLLVEGPEGRADVGSLELQGWRPRDDEITLERGLTITGRIAKFRVEARSWWWVGVRPLDAGVEVGPVVRSPRGLERRDTLAPIVRPESEGGFAVGPLPPGRYALGAGGPEQIVEAGARDVVLEGASRWGHAWLNVRLAGMVADDRGALGVLGTGGTWVRSQHLEPNGALTFVHVGEDTLYELWVGGLVGGRYVWERTLRASENESAAVVAARQGGRIEGRVVAPAGTSLGAWSIDPVGPVAALRGMPPKDAGCPCTIDAASGRFVIEGVPPGTWTVRARMPHAEGALVGQASATAGDRVVIQLSPEPQ